jgi:hypothetical protein
VKVQVGFKDCREDYKKKWFLARWAEGHRDLESIAG